MPLTIHHLKRTVRTALLAVPAIFCSAFLGYGSDYVRMRTSGDEAFAKGDYAAAASFYRRCNARAVEANDSDAVRDSYEHLIDALVLGKQSAEAEKTLSEYELRFPGVNSLSLAMWRADILILKNKGAEAEKILERILPGLTVEDPRRVRALLSLARACENSGKYEKAAETYRVIRKTKPVPALDKLAYERAVLCLTRSNSPEQAWAEILAIPASCKSTDRQIIQLLTFYAMIRTDGFGNAAAAWDKLKENQVLKPNELYHTVYFMISDCASSAGHYAMAAEAMRSAYQTAPDKDSAFRSVRRLVRLLGSAGDKAAAAKMAVRVLDIFRGPYADAETKMHFAGLLRNTGDLKNAVEIYTSIAEDPLLPRKTTENAAAEAARTLSDSGKFTDAEKIISKYFSGKDRQGSREFLLADLKLRKKDYPGAAEAFRKISADFPEYREKALYQSAVALASSQLYQRALNTLDEISRLQTDSPVLASAQYLKAVILEKMNRFTEAAETYQSYAALPRHADFAPQALFKAGILWFRSGNVAKADTAFEKLRRQWPDSPLAPSALYWRIYAARTSGNNFRAERETWLLADRYPESKQAVSALFNLAAQYLETGSPARSMDILNGILTRISNSPAVKTQVLLRKAKASFQMNRPEEAERCLNELDKEFPNSPEAAEGCYLRADQKRLAGDCTGAIEFYRKVLNRNPDPAIAAAAAGSLGDCYFTIGAKSNQKKEIKAAEEYFRTVLKRNDIPDHIRVMTLYKLGRTLELSGSDDAALSNYREALYLLRQDSGASLRFWAAKAAENTVSIAEKRPIRAHIEAAQSALNRLADMDALDRDQADERIQKLNKLNHPF